MTPENYNSKIRSAVEYAISGVLLMAVATHSSAIVGQMTQPTILSYFEAAHDNPLNTAAMVLSGVASVIVGMQADKDATLSSS